MQADPPTPAAVPAQAARPSTTSFDRTPVAPAFAGESGGAGASQAAPLVPTPAVAGQLTAFTTGAYQPSGDIYIDRMLRLEAALKRNGGGFLRYEAR